MKRLVVALLVLFGAHVAHAQLLSPGPLASAHANIDGDDDCSKCHESGKQVVARLCLDCHKDLGAEIAASRGLHGKAYKGRACEECHIEHLGRNAKLVRWPGGSMGALDHGQTGWPLEGGHKGPACGKCHTKTSPLGKPQFVATPTACGQCHADPHKGRFSAACQKCHTVTKWEQFDTRAFDHAVTRYPLTGMHAPVACDKCHGAPPTWKPLQFATCDSCHADPHRGQFRPKACSQCHDTKGWNASDASVRGSHPKLSLANGHAAVACKTCHDRGNDKPPTKGSTCVACHENVHDAPFGNKCEQCHASIKWLGLADSIGRSAHERTKYPLDGKHASTACAACHSPSKPEDARFRKVNFGTCTACHADKHKGEFAKEDCASCHTVNGFSPTTFGVAQHVQSGYTLDGKHAATPCSSCHPGARPRTSWKQPKQQCAQCHENPHGTQFAKEMAADGCAHCHTPYAWKQAKIDHSTFPLTGAHARATCVGCHGDVAQGAEAAAFRGIPRTCEGCHEDVHAGQFRTGDQPAKACTTCHTTEQWKIDRFDHTRTRYPLEGAHVKLECAKCHPTEELHDGTQAVRYRLGYVGCRDCHADPHKNAQLDCNGCHGSESWKLAGVAAKSGFDHDKTGFPLRGMHRQTGCQECHHGTQPSETCDGCHRDPHQGRMDGQCYECHTAVSWQDVAQLEQHRRTRMPLTGKHAIIECSACHKRQAERTFSDLPVDCYGCHAAEYHSANTHPNHDGTDPSGNLVPFPRTCGMCHRTTGWSPAVTDPSSVMPRVQQAMKHDASFALSTGSHKLVACAECHVDPRRPRAVRCDGCHADVRKQHSRPVATAASACLGCHPRGIRR